jgi:ribonuclease HI
MTPGPPRLALVQRFTDQRPIAYAEMAAALEGLLWLFRNLTQPLAITLLTDSSVVYHTLVKGTGVTLRRSLRLQTLFVQAFCNKIQAGHGLVTSWVPSAENLADHLSRGVHAV